MSQMGAVSVVFPIVQIIIGLGMMFGAGASSYISRLFFPFECPPNFNFYIIGAGLDAHAV